jgi:hypothetical protein
MEGKFALARNLPCFITLAFSYSNGGFAPQWTIISELEDKVSKQKKSLHASSTQALFIKTLIDQ